MILEYPQIVHMCGFARECVILCVCRLPESAVLYWHWLQLYSFSSVWFFICVLRLEDWLLEKFQCVHLWGFSPLWIRECVFIFRLNDLLHCRQPYFLTQLWVCLWWWRPLQVANIFGHKSQGVCLGIFIYHLLFLLQISFDCLPRMTNFLSTFLLHLHLFDALYHLKKNEAPYQLRHFLEKLPEKESMFNQSMFISLINQIWFSNRLRLFQ